MEVRLWWSKVLQKFGQAYLSWERDRLLSLKARLWLTCCPRVAYASVTPGATQPAPATAPAPLPLCAGAGHHHGLRPLPGHNTSDAWSVVTSLTCPSLQHCSVSEFSGSASPAWRWDNLLPGPRVPGHSGLGNPIYFVWVGLHIILAIIISDNPTAAR